MKTTDNGREARARNAKRLHNLTIGTAMIGILATGGFGALAAVTYSGTTTTSTATTANTATAFRGTATGVTRTKGSGHVSTGGS